MADHSSQLLPSCNYIESLLGIETFAANFLHANTPKLQLYWIPIRDWNQWTGLRVQKPPQSCNYIESLLGIETIDGIDLNEIPKDCCNYIESLLGIETGIIVIDGFTRR